MDFQNQKDGILQFYDETNRTIDQGENKIMCINHIFRII